MIEDIKLLIRTSHKISPLLLEENGLQVHRNESSQTSVIWIQMERKFLSTTKSVKLGKRRKMRLKELNHHLRKVLSKVLHECSKKQTHQQLANLDRVLKTKRFERTSCQFKTQKKIRMKLQSNRCLTDSPIYSLKTKYQSSLF